MFSLSPSLPASLQVRCSGYGNRCLCQGGSCHGSEDPMLMATVIIPEIGTCSCTRWSNQNTDQGFGVGGSVEKIMVMMCKSSASQSHYQRCENVRETLLIFIKSIVPDSFYASLTPDFPNYTSQKHFPILLKLLALNI